MLEGNWEKPVEKKSLKRDGGGEGEAIALPPERKLDPGHNREELFWKGGGTTSPCKQEGEQELGQVSLFFTQISEHRAICVSCSQ